MASISEQIKDCLRGSAALLDALDAMGRWRAFAILVATFLVFAVVMAALMSLSAYAGLHLGPGFGTALGFLSGLVGLFVMLAGANAAGVMLMDETRGQPPRSAGDALAFALFTTHRLIAVGLIEGLLFLAYLIVLSLMLFACKIPWLGPVLYAVVFPVGAVVTGLVVFTLLYVAFPLALPAIWNGAGVMATLSMLSAIARQRLASTVISELLLGLLVAVVAGLIGAILMIGTSATVSLSLLIVSVGGGEGGMDLLGGLMGMVMGGLDGGSGYAVAFGFGIAVLFLCGALLPLLVALKGVGGIYLRVTEGLSLGDAETRFRSGLGKVTARASEARERALGASSRQTPAAVPPTRQCPACHGSLAADDVFCQHCGQRAG
jgi:hypothetical protein